MKFVSRFILLSSLLFILLSCNRDLGGRYHIDWGSWGDEIVYNDTDMDLIVELRENKRIDNRDTTQIYTMILKPSQCDTLAISNFSKSNRWRSCYLPVRQRGVFARRSGCGIGVR